MPRTAAREPAASARAAPARVAPPRPDPPLAVLLVARDASVLSDLSALGADRRFELVIAHAVTPAFVAFAHRAAGTIVCEDDPFDALTYAVTAGLREPVLITRKRYARDRKTLLRAGALDCETLPLTARALDRIATLLRARTGASRVNPLVRLVLDPIARTARLGARCIPLSQREFALLHCLDAAEGRAMSADSLLTEVWGDRTVERTRTILEVYVCLLRRKLDTLGMRGALATVRHFGYRLGPPPAPSAGATADARRDLDAPADAPPQAPTLTPAAAARHPRHPARPGSTAR